MSAERSTKKHQTKREKKEEGKNPEENVVEIQIKKKEQTTILQVMGKQQSDILLRNALWKFRGKSKRRKCRRERVWKTEGRKAQM